MTEPSMWTRLTAENPEHSAAYIQRFRDLAAAGQDLFGDIRRQRRLLGDPARQTHAGGQRIEVIAGLQEIEPDRRCCQRVGAF